MKVLAIDPGYDRCGIAVLEKKAGKEVLLFSDCLQTSRSLPFHERLRYIGDEIKKVLKTYSADTLAIEKLYFNTNQKTAMGVAEACGVIVYIASSAGASVAEYTPAQIKTAVTGWGRADKQHVTDMVQKLISIEKKVEHDDEYDAIAVGITHLAHV